MEINAKYFYGILLAFFLTATSCIKDITNLDQGVVFSPYYSLPIGQNSIDMEMIYEAPGFDTILVADSTPDDSVFIYNGHRYYLTENNIYFDTLLTQEVDFSFLDEIINDAVSVNFRLYIESSIPSEITFQTYFRDDNGDLLFALLHDPGLVIPTSSNESKISLIYDTDELTEEEIISFPKINSLDFYYGISIQSSLEGATYWEEQYFQVELGIKVGLLREIGD